MSTQNSEISFINCPSCGSLVASVASRCRMCGFILSKSEAKSADNEAKNLQPPRVRQRTLSVTKGDLEEVKKNEIKESNDNQKFKLGFANKNDNQIEVEKEQNKSTSDEFKNLSIEQPIENKSNNTINRFVNFNEDRSKTNEPSRVVQNEVGQPLNKKKKRKKKKKLDLSRSNLNRSMPASIEDQKNLSPISNNVNQASDIFRINQEEVSYLKEEKDSEPKIEISEIKISDNSFPFFEVKSEPIKEEKMPEVEISMPIVENKVLSKDTNTKGLDFKLNEGRLFGWFVNFSTDPKGVTNEIRTGKYFIGKQRLRSSDLIISHESISTPHCLVSAVDGVLFLQDLMSENGVFIRRKDRSDWVSMQEKTKIEHGDWIKLGDYEVMVVLIPV